MTFGENYIFQCPGCTNKISRGSLMSGNTIGAKYYSDGKRIAPMMMEFPNITKCIKCHTIFWFKNAKQIGKSSWLDELKDDNENIQHANFLSIQEYFEALEKKVYQSAGEERDLRISIWWIFNDRVRHVDEKHKLRKQHIPIQFLSDDEKKQWEENTYYLIGMLDQGNSDDRIMMAELNRNTGKFDRCMEIIHSIEDENLNWLKQMFDKKCKNKDPFVFQLNPKE